MERVQQAVILSFLILVVGSGIARSDEPVWVGMEASVKVRIRDGTLSPRSEGASDTRRLPPVTITAVNPPAHEGEAWEVRYVGLKAGEHDLRDYLQVRDEKRQIGDENGIRAVPPILVRISDPLPAEHHGQLETPPALTRDLTAPGLRRVMLVGVAVLWSVGLLALFLGRRSQLRSQPLTIPESVPEQSLPKMLRLAELKLLTPQGVAGIERELLDLWRREFGLTEFPGADLIRRLEQHPRGKDLLAALDEWRRRLQSGPSRLPPLLAAYAGDNGDSPPYGARTDAPETESPQGVS